MSQAFCACGCGLPCTSNYRVHRGHADRVARKSRAGRVYDRSPRTHLPNAPKRALTERSCLRCDKAFMSWGAENRLCESCHQRTRDNPESIEMYQLLWFLAR